jgi:hypothetical protein
MRTVKTQFGISATADFEENTWTFEMPDNYSVWAGNFAIVDKQVYDKMLDALRSIENDDNSIPATIWNLRNEAIKEATE